MSRKDRRAAGQPKGSAAAHYNLANALAGLGRLDDAVAQHRRALALQPNLVGAHNNLANALIALGRAEEALAHFQRAIELAPDLVEPRVNLGSTLLQLGRLEAATEQLERALRINPDFAEAHSTLGNVLLAQGRLEEAAQRLERALALKPDMAEAHNNLGIALAARGRLDAACRSFRLALARRPRFVDAYNNLAQALLSMGQLDNALGTLRAALGVAETAETKLLFVQCVKALRTLPAGDDFRGLMIRALAEPWGRANDLAKPASRLLKQDAAISAAIGRLARASPRRLSAEELLGPEGLAALAGNGLLRALLTSTVVSDVELERLLTTLRRVLLELALAAESPLDPAWLGFCCALAQQCFLNEQVFAVGDDELARAGELRDRLSAALASGAAPSEPQLVVTALYFPLHAVPGAEALLSRGWSDPVSALLARQLGEPLQERRLAASIAVLTPIEDPVSQAVRRQYEENPYPRWTKAAPPPRALPFDQYLRRKLPGAPFRGLGKAQIEVLIAGCGTGQHAIETAQRFAEARVLAVDLSLTSLAYAKRKSLELGRGNIEHGQADILALGSLGRSFDVIEASGVLHHLADPLAGWRVLLSLLRPDGIMTLGLYSETARAGIVKARAFIAERGYPPSAEGIRRCRQDMIAYDDGGAFRDILAADDFFSTSGCRDLLFHVQERRLTIPEIAAFVADNALTFIGFDLDPIVAQQYLTRFPHDTTLTDLRSWDAFERDNPATFSGMYQFWVQKQG